MNNTSGSGRLESEDESWLSSSRSEFDLACIRCLVTDTAPVVPKIVQILVSLDFCGKGKAGVTIFVIVIVIVIVVVVDIAAM